MLVEIIGTFLAISLLFYCIFAGADFGGGILEIFIGQTKKKDQVMVISRAIAPVWEANHVWIILAVVILFCGFPKAFAELSIQFHIPILIMLVGIILRGCAFTFRHYDAVKDRSQKVYSGIFVFSSVLTPLMLGMIAGGLFLGRAPMAGGSFFESYLGPWLNLFSFSLGLFTCTLFAFLAAVYLVGETTDPNLKVLFSKKARAANVIAIFAGALVFISGQIDGVPLLQLFLANPVSLAAILLATAALWPLWVTLKRGSSWIPRFLAGTQVFFILTGWFSLQYPAILVGRAGALTIYNSAAPELTLRYLLYALVVGFILIFPSLLYLMGIFKKH